MRGGQGISTRVQTTHHGCYGELGGVVVNSKAGLEYLNTRIHPTLDPRHADTDKRAVRQPQFEGCALGPQAYIHFAVAATSSFRF